MELCASSLSGSLQLPASARILRNLASGLGLRHRSQAFGWSRKGSSCRGRGGMAARCEGNGARVANGPDLSVTVSGLRFSNPFVIRSGPPGTNYTVMKRAFDEGWSGVIAKTVSDTLFTWSDLQAKQNNELLKNLGNFVHRSLSFLIKPLGEGYDVDIVPAHHQIGVPFPVVFELKDEEVDIYPTKFAGSQADRSVAAAASGNPATPSVAPGEVNEGSKSSKGGETQGKKATPEVKIAPIDVTRLDIRVGVITKVQKHPDADSLYVEEIDVGESAPRTVVSGLVKFIPIDELQNLTVCVLCNLKPVKMRGIVSHAMVLAASNADHTQVELVVPPEGAQVGERITFPGYEGEPDQLLNPKKKVWEAVQADLHTTDDLVAVYKHTPFTTTAGVCKVPSIKSGAIR